MIHLRLAVISVHKALIHVIKIKSLLNTHLHANGQISIQEIDNIPYILLLIHTPQYSMKMPVTKTKVMAF